MLGHWTARIRNAIVFASNWHDGQRRKECNVPYNAHLWQVHVLLALSGADDDTQIAGIFHDILEDTDVRPELLGWLFGSEVLRMVEVVTDPKGKDWEERKKIIIERIKTAELKIKLIKCADKLDNLQSIAELLQNEGFREGQDNRQSKIWDNFTKGYEGQKWFNQEILKALFANVPYDDLPAIFGTYMRLVEKVFGEQVITDEVAREKVKSM